MEVENLTPTDRQLLNLLLALLREGIYVGGKRSGGLGRIRLAGAVTVRGFESAAELWRAMTAGRDPHGALTWEEGAHAQAPAL
jgi:CRISPR/Cas system CSM-associated protein Csm3 (group 7 of RAMP superfamily)